MSIPHVGSTTMLPATINGQPGWEVGLGVQQDVTYVRSATAVKPDPSWEYIDPAGHYHAWADNGGLPTLRAKAIDLPCDGSCGHENPAQCEGFPVTVYRCRVCGAPVDPQVVPDVQARTVGTRIEGLRSWDARAINRESRAVPAALNGEVSVVVRDGDRTLFGFALLVGYEMDGGLSRGGPELTVQLVGSGELGERGA